MSTDSDLSVVEDIPEVTLEDLNPLWITADGLPTFFFTASNLYDLVESLGFNIYYVLGNNAEEVKSSASSNVTYNSSNKTAAVTPVTVLVKNAQFYRVVNSFVSRTVSECSPELAMDFCTVEEEATYDMPPIPHLLIDKLDQFFRLVDAQHGTESIVMLTYDIDKEGSDGWGILVPDQTNTSVHCNYDPDSIAQIKPDNVMIVGSVHSHPGMSAYASGTDHKDQADFDGIHITFGWQKSVNNGATQYHIELQSAGKAYKLDPEDVFEDYIIDKAPDPEVVGWTDKVKKVSPPSTGGTLTAGTVPVTPGEAYQTPRPPAIPKTQGSTAVGTSPKAHTYINYSTHLEDIIEEAVDPSERILLICEPSYSNDRKHYNCPSCFASISVSSVRLNNCCGVCDIPICELDTTADEIVYSAVDYCRSRNMTLDVAFYLLTKDYDSDYMVLRLTPTTAADYINDQWDGVANLPDSTTSNYYDLTLCCNQIKEDCFCPTQVLNLDTFDFDQFMGNFDCYDQNSACFTCENYYTSECPPYRTLVVNYMNNPKSKEPEHYAGTLTSEGCSHFRSFAQGASYYEYGD